MISVAEATGRLLALVAPLGAEEVALRRAAGRVLAREVTARHAQPPFPASAMDGYAIAGETPKVGTAFRLVGTSAAGHPHSATVGPGEAIRILTGAAIPDGADRVVIQEDVEVKGGAIRITRTPGGETHVRSAGGDFTAGFALPGGTPLGSRAIALLAAMGHATMPVMRRPVVAIVMTGDELRAPGEPLEPGQIAASNGYGLAAMLEEAGAEARLLPVARDDAASLAGALRLGAGADVIVTVGGASVGDHDIVAGTAEQAGLETSFHKVAMRPGKPLLAGRLGGAALVGLPGNPVSAMVCGVVFLLPLVRRMLGLDPSVPTRRLPLGAPVDANGPRAHYMRARETDGACVPEPRQDSSLLSVLAGADLLLPRPPGDGPRAAGEVVEVIDFPR